MPFIVALGLTVISICILMLGLVWLREKARRNLAIFFFPGDRCTTGQLAAASFGRLDEVAALRALQGLERGKYVSRFMPDPDGSGLVFWRLTEQGRARSVILKQTLDVYSPL